MGYLGNFYFRSANWLDRFDDLKMIHLKNNERLELNFWNSKSKSEIIFYMGERERERDKVRDKQKITQKDSQIYGETHRHNSKLTDRQTSR